MHSCDLCLCAHVVSGGFREARDAGIDPSHIMGDGRKAYEYVLSHLARHGKVPDAATVEQETNVAIPPLSEIPEPCAYYIDKLKRRALDRLVCDHVKACAAAVETMDAEKAVVSATDMLAEIGRRNMTRERISDLTKLVEDRWDGYLARKERPSGIPTPWPILNEYTGGMAKGDLWIVAGRPATGKTWSAIRIALYAWELGKRPLFVSMEMPSDRILRRMDAMHARLPYREFRRGALPPHQEQDYRKAMDYLKRDDLPALRLATRSRIKTVRDLSVEIAEERPDLVIVDGVYKLRPEHAEKFRSMWESANETIDRLQEMAHEREVPVVVTTQLNREQTRLKGRLREAKGGLEHLAFADAFGMNADVVLGLFSDPTMRQQREILYRVLKNREDETVAFKARFDLDLMDFREIGLYEEDGGSDGGKE